MSVDSEMGDVINETREIEKVEVVPWHNAAQFKKVYEYLFSEELVKKKWAYDTISVWDTRCHPSLPTAIEATYLLTGAVIQDILWTNEASLAHYTDVQSLYGSAITRFVSLLVEVNKDSPFQSASAVAKLIGIPSFIADMRNEFCHGSRPSLSVFRIAAENALKYLKESYWDKEVCEVKNFMKNAMDETQLKFEFKKYICSQLKFLSKYDSKAQRMRKEKNESKREFIELISNLERYVKINKQLFVKVLVSDDIFIPLEDDFKTMISSEEYSLFKNEQDFEDCYDHIDEEEESMEYFDSVVKILPELPEVHEALWAPVISVLNKYDAVPMFMEALLRSQGNRTTVGQKLIIVWILKILRIHSPCASVESSSHLKQIFRRKGIVPNWHSLFYSAVKNPCYYSSLVLPLILSNLNLKKAIMLRIINMLAIYLGMHNDKKREGSKREAYYDIHSAEEVKQVLDRQRIHAQVKPANSIWHRIDLDNCEDPWPIGCILNSLADDDEDEEMEEDILELCQPFEFEERKLPSNENDVNDDTEVQEKSLALDKMYKVMKNRSILLYKK